jgi:hypothetical protein
MVMMKEFIKCSNLFKIALNPTRMRRKEERNSKVKRIEISKKKKKERKRVVQRENKKEHERKEIKKER